MPASVLVVDDDPDLLASLDFVLSDAGYAVSTAADGAAALRAVGLAPPDLMLLDVMVSRRDGYDVCQTLRAHPDPTVRRLPVLMLSARARREEREKGLALGADDYLAKPFKVDDLLQRVARLAGGGGA